jgi:hypothetical protein
VRIKDLTFPPSALSALLIHKLSLFQHDNHIYLYSEFLDTESPSEVENIAERVDHLFSQISLEGPSMDWRIMQEVFHAG